ncbi:MAG: glycosyltransferase [Bacteroidales bacterium]|nr:glycosyltransferase [Bacteroidales bacterium]
MNKPLVSIFCVSYNHEQFIAQALDGFVMQKTNFDYEKVISDDCSTDNTKSIINEYIKKYPKLFKDVSPRKNLGMQKNWLHTLNACTGKYIALCEGDDYWTDANKLQKQVDFMEANDEYVMCFHKTEVSDLLSTDSKYKFVGWCLDEDRDFTIKEYFNWNFCATTSIVFKSAYLFPLPQDFVEYPVGDYLVGFILFIRSQKKARYFHQNMAVYHNHSGGHGKGNAIEIYYKSMIDFYKKLQKNVLQGNYLKESTEQLISFNRKLYKENIQQHKYFQASIYFLKYLIFRFKLKF